MKILIIKKGKNHSIGKVSFVHEKRANGDNDELYV